MQNSILIYHYVPSSTTTEVMTDYVGNRNPSITISDLTKLTEAKARTIITNSSITGLGSGSYSATYTFSDNISVNSLTFKTGASGMSQLPVTSISVEAYNNGSWTKIIDAGYVSPYGGDNKSYTYNKDETLIASSAVTTNKIRLNFTGFTYSGGGLTYYASFHKFVLNVNVTKTVPAGVVPQPHLIYTKLNMEGYNIMAPQPHTIYRQNT